MLIEFECPHCKTKLTADTDLVGKKGACPNCKKEITIPAQGTRPASDKEGTAKKE